MKLRKRFLSFYWISFILSEVCIVFWERFLGFIKLKISSAVGFLGERGPVIIFIEGTDDVATEILESVIVEGEEAKKVVEVIFCECAIIDSLELRIEIDCLLELFLQISAKISRDEIIDGELSLPATVKHAESFINLNIRFFIYLPL